MLKFYEHNLVSETGSWVEHISMCLSLNSQQPIRHYAKFILIRPQMLSIELKKNAGLFESNFGYMDKNMDKPSHWVKNVFKICNPMTGYVHILPKI